MDFNQFVLREQYKKIENLKDRLQQIKNEVDWAPFREIISKIFVEERTKGGRPNTDEIIIARCLILQGLYGLSDEELEYQCNDRLSFQNFLDFPKKVPDFSTIWKHRDALKEKSLDKEIWDELQRQIDAKGYTIKKGVIQDATFIESDLGKKRYSQEKRAKKKGYDINYTEKQKQHMDKDAKFAVKNNQVHFGYKNHMKCDIDYLLVRNIEVTPANIHDNNIDLTEEGDNAMYRDRGYSGTPLKFVNVNDRTMIRKDKNKDWVKAANKAISIIRVTGEKPFAVVKRVFNGTRTYVKTLDRVFTKEVFKYVAYNLYQLVTLRKKLARAI